MKQWFLPNVFFFNTFLNFLRISFFVGRHGMELNLVQESLTAAE